ncbi:MAG: sensor histidine kinase [Janthinobacterium lividum]
MTRQIKLLVALMAACTLALAGLQAYWNHQAYRTATRTFRRDANEALAEAAGQEIRLRQGALLRRYRAWLADTSAIVLRGYTEPVYGSPRFSVADKHPFPKEKRAPYEIGFTDFPGRLGPRPARLDAAARAFFLQHFTAGAVASDVREGMAYFYTKSLGDKLIAAYAADTVHTRRLARLYAQALRRREVAAPFRLAFGGAGGRRPGPRAAFATAAVEVGFGKKEGVQVRAEFADPNRAYLGRTKWVLLGSVGLIGVVVFCFAATARALLSQARLAALKDDFVNNMTHELKTPVATIGVAAEALERFALGPAATAEYLGIIRQQAARLGALADKILQSVVAEHAGLALARQPLCLGALLAPVLREAQPRLAQAGGRLAYAAPAGPVPVVGDAVHLTNVLATLLDNALKYGRPGGEIALWCGAENGQAVVRIANEGPAIPAQYQARVFEKFFRVPTGNRHDVPGSGLGLHYARALVARHGGTLALHSQAGRTTFTIRLPLAAAPHADAPAPPAAARR